LPRHPETPPSTKNESRIYLYIATIKKTKNGPKVYKGNWRIMVDETTQLKFSDFFDTKNGMVEETCEQLHRWKESGRGAKIIRLDNSGEN
jgi:phosphopentomutase